MTKGVLMQRIAAVVGLVSLLLLCSCTQIFAQIVSGKVADDLLSMKSYRGRLVEVFADGDGGAEAGTQRRQRLVKTIYYQRPWKIRAEIVEPAEQAGSLFICDGETMTLWWPREFFAIRIRGLSLPGEDRVREVLEEGSRWLLERYTFSYQGEASLAGRDVTRWQVVPSRKEPYLFPYRSWLDGAYSFPLKLEVQDAPTHLWYSMEFQEIAFGTAPPPDVFALELPQRTVVFDWDLEDPGQPLAELRGQMNFDVLVPTRLPEGLQVEKIIRGRHSLPMCALIMENDSGWLSLTEMRRFGREPQAATGIPVKIQEEQGYLSFLGTFSSVSWFQGNTALTLTGNLPYPELLAVAASVGPAENGARVGPTVPTKD
ncbi:sigma-E factor regulatory protein RseB domain-containing protein [Planctomycetota bacterium]